MLYNELETTISVLAKLKITRTHDTNVSETLTQNSRSSGRARVACIRDACVAMRAYYLFERVILSTYFIDSSI